MRIWLSSLFSGLWLLLNPAACDGAELNWTWLKDSDRQPQDLLEQGERISAALYLVGASGSVGIWLVPPRNWSVKFENSKNRLLLSSSDLHSSMFLRLEPERPARNKPDWKKRIQERLKERHPEISEWETQTRTNSSCEVVVFEGSRVIPMIGEAITHVEVLRFPEVLVELTLVTDDAARLNRSMITFRRMIDSIRPLTTDELGILTR